MDSECVLSVWTLAVLPSALCGLREGSVPSVVLFVSGDGNNDVDDNLPFLMHGSGRQDCWAG